MLQDTLAVASDGLLVPTLSIPLSIATRGYIIGSFIIDEPVIPPVVPKPIVRGPGGGIGGRYPRKFPPFIDAPTKHDKIPFVDRIKREDQEILEFLTVLLTKGIL